MTNGQLSLIEDAERGIDEANEMLKGLAQNASRKIAESSDTFSSKAKQAIATIEEKRSAVETILSEARRNSGAAMEDVKIGLEMAWNDLKDTVESVRERF